MKNLTGKERFKSWLPHGFEFRGPADARRLHAVCDSIRTYFTANGFEEVIPPLMDFAPTFKLARERNSWSFESRDIDGENLAIRSDLTVQVVKAAASGTLSPGGGFFYIQPVLVDQPSGSGHRRQILQAGVELLGDRSGRVNEMIRLTLDSPWGKQLSLIYGDQRFLRILLAETNSDSFAQATQLLDKKDVAGLKNFAGQSGLSSEARKILLELPFLSGKSLDAYRSVAARLPALLPVIDESPSAPGILYDFGLVRDLSYYTGPVFQAYANGNHEPVLAGGVYDGLFEKFSGKHNPACGFAFDAELLAFALSQESGMRKES
ncbi:MAG: ATP phosphoribosyltransferase regulatory subunit [Spirochaetia bacterium]|nr:ATP phosphoribosyltransferase regulatory subunit [Spirochaetia bacterium]